MTKRVSQYEFPAAKSFWRKLSSFITARLCQKLIRSAIGNPDSALENCQGGDSNSRPRAYESPALPLSYPGFYFVQKSLANSLKRPTPNAFGAALAPSYPCEIGGDKAQSHDLRCQRERKTRISFPTLFLLMLLILESTIFKREHTQEREPKLLLLLWSRKIRLQVF